MYYGDKVILRLFRRGEGTILAEKFNSMELRKTLSSVLPYSIEEEEEWIASHAPSMKKGTQYIFVIENYAGDMIGSIGIHNANHTNRNGELGIAIWERGNRGRGYGSDAIKVILCLAFQYLNFHSVFLRHVAYNERGRHVYEKIGFQPAGVLRNSVFYQGKYHDMHLMDIMHYEFKEKWGDFDIMLPRTQGL